MKHHFSWKNFILFVCVLLALFFCFWFFWSIVDINLHDLEKSNAPSNYNMFVIYTEILKMFTE